MKLNLNQKVLGIALGLGLTGGAVGILAQTSVPQNTVPIQTEKSAQSNQDNEACPMMKDGKMDMSMMKDGQMDMSKMMDCCKKMGMMKSDGPAADKKDNPKQ
ncbi:MAG TPA: hypothetical protein VNI84_09775 [Pyrinomonadaceae bacterium]|nr:hypothetical protein [Pyrinomonadaceae bacterium]